MPTPPTDIVPAKPAASVLLLRPGSSGPEALYLLRSKDLAFQADHWVFPGGRIDPSDVPPETSTDDAVAARRAAVREAKEEAGLELDGRTLRYLIHWTTPTNSRIRFATWFFIAPAPAGEVRVDKSEIRDFRWLRPADAVRLHDTNDIRLPVPTFALSTRLSTFPTVEAAMRGVAAWPNERLMGHVRAVEGGHVVVYAPDVGYDGGALDRAGPRHRLWMFESGWRYEREF